VGQIKTLPFSIAVVPMIVCYQIHILIIVEDLADVLTHFLIAVLEWELLVVFIRLTVERRTDALPDLLFALVRQVIDQMFLAELYVVDQKGDLLLESAQLFTPPTRHGVNSFVAVLFF